MTALNDDLKAGNPRAASIRIGHCDVKKLAGQRRHDLRIGAQLGYVDAARVDANSVLIEPAPPSLMRDLCQERRAQRDMKRAMKRNASVATVGIITFGSEAAQLIERMSVAQQDAAFRELTQAVADRLNTTVHGLVVHRDEATVHAHFQLAASDLDGHPLAQTTRPAVLSGLQDLAAEVMGRHCPGIERGRRYGDRLAAGADFADVVHRSVRELHRDLPRDLEAKRAKLVDLAAAEAAAQERVEEMSGRVAKLQQKGELTVRELKRLATYEGRLKDRVEELELARQASEAARLEEERLARLAQEDRFAQEQAAAAIAAKAEGMRDAVAALTQEVADQTIRRADDGKIRARDPGRLKRGFPEVAPAVAAAADLGSELASARASIDQDRQAVAEDRRDLEAGQRDLVRQALALDADRAEVESLRDRLHRALAVVTRWLRRPDLTAEARHDGEDLLRHAGPLVVDPFSAPKEPIPPGGPGL